MRGFQFIYKFQLEESNWLYRKILACFLQHDNDLMPFYGFHDRTLIL
jgi:hypothetical protein